MENPVKRPPQPGRWSAAVLSVLMHGLLLFFLYYNVHWLNKPVDAASVDLVRGLPAPPQAALPPPPQPQPQPEPERPAPPPKPVEEAKPQPEPHKADIDVKAPEKKKQEKKKEEKKEEPKPEKKPEPKPEKKPEPKPEKKPEPDKKPEPKKPEPPRPPMDNTDRLLNKEMARLDDQKMDARLAKEQSAARAAIGGGATSSALGKWSDAVRSKVGGNIRTSNTSWTQAEIEVELLVTGELKSEPKITKSSGNRAVDEAILRAVKISIPLPKPPDEILRQPVRLNINQTDLKFAN